MGETYRFFRSVSVTLGSQLYRNSSVACSDLFKNQLFKTLLNNAILIINIRNVIENGLNA